MHIIRRALEQAIRAGSTMHGTVLDYKLTLDVLHHNQITKSMDKYSTPQEVSQAAARLCGKPAFWAEVDRNCSTTENE